MLLIRYHKLFSVVSGRMRPHTVQRVKALNKPGDCQIIAGKLINFCRNGLGKKLSSLSLIISTLAWWLKPSPSVSKIVSLNSSSEKTLYNFSIKSCGIPVNWVSHFKVLFEENLRCELALKLRYLLSLGQKLSRLRIHCAFRVADYSVRFIALLTCSRHHLSLLWELCLDFSAHCSSLAPLFHTFGFGLYPGFGRRLICHLPKIRYSCISSILTIIPLILVSSGIPLLEVYKVDSLTFHAFPGCTVCLLNDLSLIFVSF